jgi:hypothetical protein
MSPEKLFPELLNLGAAWRVGEIDFDPDGRVLIRIEETEAFWREARSIFAEDGAVKCYDHVGGVCWRHLNVFEHRGDIVCRLPRAPCLKTGKVYRVTPPWEGLSKAFTKAFEALAILLMREMPVCPAAGLINETDTRLWRLLRAQMEHAWPCVDWSEVSIVGCDELSAPQRPPIRQGLLRSGGKAGAFRRGGQRQKCVGKVRRRAWGAPWTLPGDH